MKKSFAVSLVAGLVSGNILALDVEPEITNLSVVQNDSRMVSITYTLSQAAIMTLDLTTNGVSIGRENVLKVFDPSKPTAGYPLDVIVQPGEHALMWKPVRDWPGHVFRNGEFAVELKAWSLDNPPDYMVVDLQSPYARHYYQSADDLPNGGVTNSLYKTEKLVMRKITAAGITWRMGSPASESTFRDPSEVLHYVTMTNDYFISVYPLTTYQRIRGTGVGFEWGTKPAAGVSYNAFRGSPTTDGATWNWPTHGHAVKPDSELDVLRTRTGLQFDFPTEAQWEYACRAGSEGSIWGTPSADYGWFVENASGTYKEVGTRKPNGWGLFDMNGLVSEWVLDQWGTPSEDAVVEPTGPSDTPGKRVTKGGSAWYNFVVKGRSASRIGYASSAGADENVGGGFGIRLCCPAKLPR